MNSDHFAVCYIEENRLIKKQESRILSVLEFLVRNQKKKVKHLKHLKEWISIQTTKQKIEYNAKKK